MIQLDIPYDVVVDLMAEARAACAYFDDNVGGYGHNKVLSDFKGRALEWAVEQLSGGILMRGSQHGFHASEGDLIHYPHIPLGHYEVKECNTFFRNKRGGFPVTRQHADHYVDNNRGAVFFGEVHTPYPYDMEGHHSYTLYGWAFPSTVREAPYCYDNVQHEQALRYNRKPKDKYDHIVSLDMIHNMDDEQDWVEFFELMDDERERRFGIGSESWQSSLMSAFRNNGGSSC